MQKANKPDRLEKELEKYVIRTLRNTHNTDGQFVIGATECTLFSESLKSLIEIRANKRSGEQEDRK